MYALTGGTKKDAGSRMTRPFQWISPDSAGSNPSRTRQQRRLACTDPARYDRKAAPLQPQIDIDDALIRTGEAICQAGGGKSLQQVRLDGRIVAGGRKGTAQKIGVLRTRAVEPSRLANRKRIE